MTGPLDGVRVVELGVWVAGPGAAGILADWGADVVKIEPLVGDPSRTFAKMLGGDLDVNPVFELDNRGKRSAALDLSHPDGLAVAMDLLAEADVFVTNIRAGALERLGLGPDTLRARFPRLVYAVITAYGDAGEDADRAAFDVGAYWSRAGIAASLRSPGGPLPFQRAGMGDHSVAMTGAAMVSAALFARTTSGEGQVVSTSLLRQGAYTIGFDVNVSLMWGRSVALGQRETMGNPAINNYRAGDGKDFWLVGLQGERHWPPLARAVDHPDWLTDERYATAVGRFTNARELIAELDAIFATRTMAEWAEVFDRDPELFWAPVNTVDDLLVDDQFHASGAIVEVPDEEGARSMLATPADFDGTPPQPRWRAPLLGEHTRAILGEAGRDEAEVDRLVAAGIAAVVATSADHDDHRGGG